ncbi:hypothetical protein K8S19_10780 [bacterium]|nr:hypothetical protein [bacterium]
MKKAPLECNLTNYSKDGSELTSTTIHADEISRDEYDQNLKDDEISSAFDGEPLYLRLIKPLEPLGRNHCEDNTIGSYYHILNDTDDIRSAFNIPNENPLTEYHKYRLGKGTKIMKGRTKGGHGGDQIRVSIESKYEIEVIK